MAPKTCTRAAQPTAAPPQRSLAPNPPLPTAEAQSTQRAELCTKLNKLTSSMQAQLEASNEANRAWEARCMQSEGRFDSFKEAFEVRGDLVMVHADGCLL